MTKVVKYEGKLVETGATCAEKMPGCEKKAEIHVCFEDGSGEYVCKSCFEANANKGKWITDSTEILLAS